MWVLHMGMQGSRPELAGQDLSYVPEETYSEDYGT